MREATQVAKHTGFHTGNFPTSHRVDFSGRHYCNTCCRESKDKDRVRERIAFGPEKEDHVPQQSKLASSEPKLASLLRDNRGSDTLVAQAFGFRSLTGYDPKDILEQTGGQGKRLLEQHHGSRPVMSRRAGNSGPVGSGSSRRK